jgi:hypothetical protein
MCQSSNDANHILCTVLDQYYSKCTIRIDSNRFGLQ